MEEKRKEFRVACNIFVTRKNRLLLGLRKNCFGAGSWGLIGGHLEDREKLIDCAKRELKEELGIENVDLKLVAVSDYLGITQYIHIGFLLENYEGEIKLMEPEKCEEWKFFDIDNLPENIFDSHQDLIKAFIEKKQYL